MDLKSLIRDIPDFPKPGIVFRDFTTLINHGEAFKYTIDSLAEKITALGLKPEYIVGIESRGFIIGGALAHHFQAGFVPVRKPGKLPAPVYTVEYELEYGTDKLQIHQDAIPPGGKVFIVDDLLATGGTAKATADLLDKLKCEILGLGFIIELTALEGRKRLADLPIINLIEY